MALVNPNIAMSFRQPEFRPRNAMAEYAQMQQIEGGQRQAEIADMQLESLRRERDALSQIQAAIVAKGGPPDLDAAADAMIKTGRPEYVTQGMAIHTARRNQRNAEAYFKQYGGGAAPAMPSSTPGAMTAPAELAAGAQPESMAPVPGVISTSRVPGVVTAPITAPMGTMREIAPGGGMGAERPLAPANALAPLAATPVNAMVAPAAAATPVAPDANAARLSALEARYRQIGNNPELASERALVFKQIEAAMRGDQNRPLVVGNRLVSPTGQELYVGPQGTASLPVSIAEFERAQQDPRFMQFLQDRAAAIRPPAAPRPEPAPRTQQVTMSDGTLGIVNMDTGVITPSTVGGAPAKGKPSAFAEKAAAQKAQMNRDLNFAITQLGDITKDGGLIDQSTGSGAGRLIDIGAGFVGQATEGAIAIGKIAPVADLVLKMVPRFEGPQSNKDTQSYKEAAGQLADPTLPTKVRKEAGKTVLRLMKERQGQFVTSDMSTEGAAPAAPTAAPPLPPGFTQDKK